MTELLGMFDDWLMDGAAAALVAREQLVPVEGTDAVIFPPTFAASEDRKSFPGGYNIDTFPDGTNVCLIDSVGAQANRIEPLFARSEYAQLVPQIVVIAGERRLNLLEAGHRAGDAVVRFSSVGVKLWEAFKDLVRSGDAEKLAKIAPTSLVFGVWDSRGTQAKVPRAFRSVIRAFNVRPMTRSAQYIPPIDYKEEGVVSDELDKGSGDENPLSREGFKHNPAVKTPGGVVVGGEIRREMIVNLSAIRLLRAADDTRVQTLQRYILGLALVAATARNEERFRLREGCLLRIRPGATTAWRVVHFEGDDKNLSDLDLEMALRYAKEAAAAFGVGDSDEVEFDKRAASAWLSLPKKEQDKRRRNGPMTKQFVSGSTTAESGGATGSGKSGRGAKKAK